MAKKSDDDAEVFDAVAELLGTFEKITKDTLGIDQSDPLTRFEMAIEQGIESFAKHFSPELVEAYKAKHGYDPVHDLKLWAHSEKQQPKLLRMLAELGYSRQLLWEVNFPNIPLSTVKWFRSGGVDIDAPLGSSGRIPLNIVADSDAGLLSKLLSLGADVAKAKAFGATLIDYAIPCSSEEAPGIHLAAQARLAGISEDEMRENGWYFSRYEVAKSAGNKAMAAYLEQEAKLVSNDASKIPQARKIPSGQHPVDWLIASDPTYGDTALSKWDGKYDDPFLTELAKTVAKWPGVYDRFARAVVLGAQWTCRQKSRSFYSLAGLDRRMSFAGGLPWTCDKYPWPQENGRWQSPLVQVNLSELPLDPIADFPAILLQVWGNQIDQPLVREIPLLKRNGLNRLPRGTRLRKVHTKRYNKQVPGHHIQMDVKFLTFIGKKGEKTRRFQYTAIDDATRVRALKVYKKHTQANAIDFVDHIIEKFPFRIREIRTDNGHEFQAKFHWHVEDLGIRHAYIKRGTPQLNGKVERSHRSDQQEFYQLLSYKGDVDLEDKLDQWERFYNFHRPHGAFNGKTPYEALRERL